MTELVHRTAAAVAAMLIMTATFAPFVAVPQAGAASAIALPFLA